MDAMLLLLINCVIAVNCQSTLSYRNDDTREYVEFVEMKSEIKSIHEILRNLQKTADRIETRAIQTLKSEIEEIRHTVLQLKNENAAQVMQEMKSDIGEIRQIALKQQNCIDTQAIGLQTMISNADEILKIVFKQENDTNTMVKMKLDIGEIHQIMLNHHGNESRTMQEMKSKTEEILKIVVKEENNDTKAMKEMKSDIGEIRQIMLKQHGNETQAMQEMKSNAEEIIEMLIKQQGSCTQAIQEMKLTTADIHQIVIQQHGSETQAMQEMKLKTEEILQIAIKQQGSDARIAQSVQEMKLKTDEIRQIVIRRHFNETQAVKEIHSKMEEIRQAVNEQQNRPRKECPFGFDYLPEAASCFMLIVERMTWDNATERCREILPGVHLAVITSQEENAAIIRYLQSQFRKNNIGSAELLVEGGSAYSVWIGGQRRNPGQCNDIFVWKTLREIKIPFNYTNWKVGEPNCQRNESCVHIRPSQGHAWNDNKCDYLNLALCEV